MASWKRYAISGQEMWLQTLAPKLTSYATSASIYPFDLFICKKKRYYPSHRCVMGIKLQSA